MSERRRSRSRIGTVDVAIDDTTVAITPRGWWKLLSLRRRLELPRAAVVRARVVQDPTQDVPVRLRVGGTRTRSVRAGYMRGSTGRSWWCYRCRHPALVIELAQPQLNNVVVTTDDDPATAAMLNS